jgi:hypothetical protein
MQDMKNIKKGKLLQPFYGKDSFGSLGEVACKLAMTIGGAAAIAVSFGGALHAQDGSISLDLDGGKSSVETVDNTRAKLGSLMDAVDAVRAGDAGGADVPVEDKPDGHEPFKDLADEMEKPAPTGDSLRDRLNNLMRAVDFISAGNEKTPEAAPALIGSAGESGSLLDQVKNVQLVSAGPEMSEDLNGKPTLDMLHDLQIQAAKANDYQQVEKFVEARDVFQELLDKAANGSDTVYDQSKLRRISRITKEMHEEAFSVSQPDPTISMLDQLRDKAAVDGDIELVQHIDETKEIVGDLRVKESAGTMTPDESAMLARTEFNVTRHFDRAFNDEPSVQAPGLK